MDVSNPYGFFFSAPVFKIHGSEHPPSSADENRSSVRMNAL